VNKLLTIPKARKQSGIFELPGRTEKIKMSLGVLQISDTVLPEEAIFMMKVRDWILSIFS